MSSERSQRPGDLVGARPESLATLPGLVLEHRGALQRQAASAVVLFVGFYLLALLTVGLLLLTPFLVFGAIGLFSPYLVISSYGLALIILVALTPRPDRFTPPGPRLDAVRHPRLFALIGDVAARTGQTPPPEVYLTSGVNAFVTQRGGIMGLGSRRVMGVGLGLLEVLTMAEFRAVLAHEFGHYYAGHLRPGPWIYQARMAMRRTVDALGAWNPGLYSLYGYYVRLFLRVTQQISRAQEFVADQLAARLYGVGTTSSSLRKVHAAGRVFNDYWENEIAPRVRAGYRPAVLARFAQLTRPAALAEAGAGEAPNRTPPTAQSKAGVYESHPALAERLRALEALPGGHAGDAADAIGATPAISLLDNVNELEEMLLQRLAGRRRAGALKPITWEPVDQAMTLTDYEELVRQHAGALKGLTPLSLLRLSDNMERFGANLVPTPEFLRRSDLYFVNELATKTLSAALMLALRQSGWQVQLLPDGRILCSRGDDTFEPFKVIQRMATGRVNSEALRRQYLAAGIADVDLGSVTNAPLAPG